MAPITKTSFEKFNRAKVSLPCMTEENQCGREEFGGFNESEKSDDEEKGCAPTPSERETEPNGSPRISAGTKIRLKMHFLMDREVFQEREAAREQFGSPRMQKDLKSENPIALVKAPAVA